MVGLRYDAIPTVIYFGYGIKAIPSGKTFRRQFGRIKYQDSLGGLPYCSDLSQTVLQVMSQLA